MINNAGDCEKHNAVVASLKGQRVEITPLVLAVGAQHKLSRSRYFPRSGQFPSYFPLTVKHGDRHPKRSTLKSADGSDAAVPGLLCRVWSLGAYSAVPTDGGGRCGTSIRGGAGGAAARAAATTAQTAAPASSATSTVTAPGRGTAASAAAVIAATAASAAVSEYGLDAPEHAELLREPDTGLFTLDGGLR